MHIRACPTIFLAWKTYTLLDPQKAACVRDFTLGNTHIITFLWKFWFNSRMMQQLLPTSIWDIQMPLWAVVWWIYQQPVLWMEHTPIWPFVQALVLIENGTWWVCAWSWSAWLDSLKYWWHLYYHIKWRWVEYMWSECLARFASSKEVVCSKMQQPHILLQL